MLSTLRALVASLFASPRTGEGAVAPFFDNYNSEGATLQITTAVIGTTFTVSAVCLLCQKTSSAKKFVINAADDNLARAVRFVMTDYGGHCARVHK